MGGSRGSKEKREVFVSPEPVNKDISEICHFPCKGDTEIGLAIISNTTNSIVNYHNIKHKHFLGISKSVQKKKRHKIINNITKLNFIIIFKAVPQQNKVCIHPNIQNPDSIK